MVDSFQGGPAYRRYCDFIAANYHRMGADDGSEPSGLTAEEQTEFQRLCRDVEEEEERV